MIQSAKRQAVGDFACCVRGEGGVFVPVAAENAERAVAAGCPVSGPLERLVTEDAIVNADCSGMNGGAALGGCEGRMVGFALGDENEFEQIEERKLELIL